MGTSISALVHVESDSDVNMRVDKLERNNSKYAVLSIGDLTLFINSREKLLEISRLLEQAAQEWKEEVEVEEVEEEEEENAFY